jgi:hypothetical protein
MTYEATTYPPAGDPAWDPAAYPGGVFRRTSWGAILAGTAVAAALALLLSTVGMAIGFAAIDPATDAQPFAGLATGTAVWIVLTHVLALGAGGWTAGRLALIPRPMGAALHGATVWALATLLFAWATVIGSAAAIGTASATLGNAAQGAAMATRAVVPDTLPTPDLDRIASRLSVENLPPELQQTLRDRNVTPERLRATAQAAVANAISDAERQRATSILQAALAQSARDPGNIGATIEQAIDQLVGGPGAVLTQEDWQEAALVIESRLGLTPGESTEIANAIATGAEQAWDDLRQTADALQQQALVATEQAAETTAAIATWLTLAMLLGLAAATAAAWAARPGGPTGPATPVPAPAPSPAAARAARRM